jgi:hypothetical protein
MVLPIFSKVLKRKSPPSTLMMCEDTMKVMQKMKHHCPQDKETLSSEETEEFTLASHLA